MRLAGTIPGFLSARTLWSGWSADPSEDASTSEPLELVNVNWPKSLCRYEASLKAQLVKNPPAMQETWV